MSWSVRSDGLEDKFRPSLVARAKKRSGRRHNDVTWVVDGDPKLSDSLPAYRVRYHEGHYHCPCQGDYGAFSRHMCSHALWAMLERRGIVKSSGVGDTDIDMFEEENASPPPRDVASSPTPEGLTTYSPQAVRPDEPMDGPTLMALAIDGGPGPLPDWVIELRPHQVDAINEIVAHFTAGSKIVVLDAPTGSGKTLIAEMVRRILQVSAIYSCTTKTLQEQILADFDYAAVIKGRSNYPTADHPYAFPMVSAESCHIRKGGSCTNCPSRPEADSRHCDLCHPVGACPYLRAKLDAVQSPLAVLNMAYFLGEGNGPRSQFHGRDLAILDEADELEEELMRHIEVTVSQTRMRELGIDGPRHVTKPESWIEWVEEVALPAVDTMRHRLSPIEGLSPEKRKKRSGYDRLYEQLKMLLRPRVVDSGADHSEAQITLAHGWVLARDRGAVTFKPIKVDLYAGEYLWHLAKRFLLMSATVISSTKMAEDLGLDESDFAVVHVPSTFPPERRPIYVEPVADMRWSKPHQGIDPTELSKMLRRISQIVTHHDDQRTLVHSVSYHLAGSIVTHLNEIGLSRRVFTYRDAREREAKLTQFLRCPNGIMVAPSFERGVDLNEDACRVVVVAKVPYPNLKDKQVSARLYPPWRDDAWYQMRTVRDLVQMTGRAMRSAEDACEIYLLDGQFMKRIYKNRQLLPPWWQEALVMGGSRIPR